MKVTELIATFQRFRSSQTEASIGPTEPASRFPKPMACVYYRRTSYIRCYSKFSQPNRLIW